MKKNTIKTSGIFILLFVFTLSVDASTNVSGGIYKNTTWTLANSPYIVTDTVIVFPSVTLTIEPGVLVKFENNKRLEIKLGKLIANGTVSNPITFTSNSGNPSAGIWDGIYLNTVTSSFAQFYFCNFYYANKAIGTIFKVGGPNYMDIENCNFNWNRTGVLCASGYAYHIVNSTFRLNETGIANENSGTAPGVHIHECLIDSNSTAGIALYAGRNSITSCIIRNNGIGILDRGVNSRRYIGNLIENNVVGIKIGEYQDEIDSIMCNTICGNSFYGFYYDNKAGDSINIASNYWCTSDSTTISAAIYDGYDNINLGLTTFIPFNSVPCIASSSIIQHSIRTNKFTIYPNPASNYLNFKLSENIEAGVVKIINILGEILLVQSYDGQVSTIDITNLACGVYILQFESSHFSGRQKFLKE